MWARHEGARIEAAARVVEWRDEQRRKRLEEEKRQPQAWFKARQSSATLMKLSLWCDEAVPKEEARRDECGRREQKKEADPTMAAQREEHARRVRDRHPKEALPCALPIGKEAKGERREQQREWQGAPQQRLAVWRDPRPARYL